MSLTMHCEPCQKSFTGPVSYNQHLESAKHIKKLSSLKSFSNSNEIKKDNISETSLPSLFEHSSNSYECSTCCLKLNSFEDFEIHSHSIEHAKKTIENAERRAENVSNMVSLLIDSSDHSDNVVINSNEVFDKSDTILPEVEMFKSSFNFCNTCKKCFSGPESYKQHIESAGHIKKTELERKISLGINEIEFSCSPCKKTFSGPVPYDQHINSAIHRKKMQSFELLKKFEVDSNAKVNMTVFEPGPVKKENNPLYCKTCDIICSGPASLIQHNEGMTHMKNLLKAQREKRSDGVLCGSLQINGHNFPKEDIILPGLIDGDKDANIAKLDELITVFLPEEEINFNEKNHETDLKSAEPFDEIDFDKQNNETSLKSADPEEIDSNEQNNKIILKLSEPEETDYDDKNKYNLKLADENPDESELIQIKLDACSLTMQVKENKIKDPENKIKEISDVFETCSYCNVELHDRDELVRHFESEEHFRKRWRKNC